MKKAQIHGSQSVYAQVLRSRSGLLIKNPLGAISAVTKTCKGYQLHRELRISGAGHGLPAMVQKVTNPLEAQRSQPPLIATRSAHNSIVGGSDSNLVLSITKGKSNDTHC